MDFKVMVQLVILKNSGRLYYFQTGVLGCRMLCSPWYGRVSDVCDLVVSFIGE